ncbi:MAG: protein kinase [Chitinispirillales bacterium]|jgi:serine/threonine protein kinase|nr:protein kinase [Chitinispirillales bacterium]
MIPHESEIEKTIVERPLPLQSEDMANDNPDTESGNSGNEPTSFRRERRRISARGAVKNPYEATAVMRPIHGKTRIGQALVKDTIGTGGMATVYLLWNERLEVFRAAKLLSRDALYDRFETEIKISAKLRHPNITEIYNVGEWNGLPYMEMEYIDGENLQVILGKRGRFPEAVCCAAAMCVAAALDYAHNLEFTLGGKPYKGIIHRDLKPANIMFSKHGEVKLTDFGIARPAQASLHTTEGNIVGTMHYLSPEQMDGQNVDHRSDIYSLGALLYEMATGVKTFPHENITELMRRRTTNSFKKPTEHGFPISAALSKIILRCLEANPQNRYPDAESLYEDLHKTLASLTHLAPGKVISRFYPEVATHTETKIEPVTRKSTPLTARAAALISATMSLLSTCASALVSSLSALIKKITAKKQIVYASAALMLLAVLIFVLISIPREKNEARVIETASAPQTQEEEVVDTKSIPDSIQTQESDDAPLKSVAATESDSVSQNQTAASPAAEQKTAQPATEPPSTKVAQTAPRNVNAAPRPAPRTVASTTPTTDAEDELIKTATTAIAQRDWVTAIRTLETRDAFRAKKDQRTLLLFESYVEAKRLDRALAILDTAARTGDALYFLTAGRYWYYTQDYTRAMEMLEASLTRSSITRSRNSIFDTAIFYIALVRSGQFRAAPSNERRQAALDGWRRVEATYSSRPNSQRLARAGREIAALDR